MMNYVKDTFIFLGATALVIMMWYGLVVLIRG